MKRWMKPEVDYDAAIIGAGPAGLMAAGTAAQRGLRVCVLEKNPMTGKKLRITGKGRCNLTNNCDVRAFISNVPTNGRFLYGAASRFSPGEVMAFFEGLGLALKIERGNRVFPQSDKASDVAEKLEGYARHSGVEIINAAAQSLILEEKRIRGVQLRGGGGISARNVIICCGGASYPGTGSTGDGYRLARQAGHTVTPLRPSLVPLVAEGEDCREMMGLSLKNISIRVLDKESGRTVYEDFGEMLFTHFGLSGPVILSASTHMRSMSPGRYHILIDLKPALSAEKLDARLVREFEANGARDFINVLDSLLPRKMIPVAVRRSGIPPHINCGEITREMRRNFGALLKNFAIEIQGFRPIEEAIVTSGGICIDEIRPASMQSKLIDGLYFAGEVIDVDGYTGGFNLQIAFCTGRLAGNSVEKQGENEI